MAGEAGLGAPRPGTPRRDASCPCRPRRGCGRHARPRSRGSRRAPRGAAPAHCRGPRAADGRWPRAGQATATPAPARRSPSPSAGPARRSPAARPRHDALRPRPGSRRLGAASVRREARFTDWPVTVYSRWRRAAGAARDDLPAGDADMHAHVAPEPRPPPPAWRRGWRARRAPPARRRCHGLPGRRIRP